MSGEEVTRTDKKRSGEGEEERMGGVEGREEGVEM